MYIKLKYALYSQNPTLALTKVTDIRGNIEYLANCKKFTDGYYVKNIDLDYDNNVWVKKQAGILDHETKKYVASNYNLIFGIVEVDSNGNELKGYFTPNIYTNCIVLSGGDSSVCIDYKILSKKYYAELINEGRFISLKDITTSSIRSINNKISNYSHCPYNIEDNTDIFNRQKEIYKNSNIKIDSDIKFGSKYIKDITFGCEFETISGNLPEHFRNQYGIIICKDGSIRNGEGAYPPEYVTVPLQDAKGLQTLRNVSAEIAERSKIDIGCSYHLHIGNVAKDRLSFVALFKLCTKIQDDVFKMFPYYKTDPTGIKNKNYCKKLPLLLGNFNVTNDFNKYVNDTYVDIYSFLTGGQRPNIDNNRKVKINPWGEGKWNIKTRYYWVNFVNMVFHKRETIEFRVHTPTLNSDKIINWIFICNAIIKYAETNTQDCLTNKKITFIEVLDYYKNSRCNDYAKNLSEKLIQYYNERCEIFASDYKRNDNVSNHELVSDKNYKFNILK